MRIVGHDLSIDVPDGWEARIFRRDGGGPVLHLATFALRDGDGDFGAAATGRMRSDDVFAARLEYHDDGQIAPGVGLFSAAGQPTPEARDFGANQLQVTRRGQFGWQRFYTEATIPCCLYAVIAPARVPSERLVDALARVLATLHSVDAGRSA